MNFTKVSCSNSNNNSNITTKRQHQEKGAKDKLLITAFQSHDRSPMVSNDNDSSGYPRSENYSIVTIDDEFKKTEGKKILQDTDLSQQQQETRTILTKQLSNSTLTNNIQQDEALVIKTNSYKHKTRFIIALLGLTIAVVNCYAQATFCISIVEMVLPSDYVFKAESGDNSVVKVIINGSSTTGVVVPAQRTANLEDQETIDHSCPVEYKYRNYYDSWRFPTPESSKNLTLQQQQKPIRASSTSGSFIDTTDRFDWDASRQGLLLGAFAIGTAPLQILGGRLAEIYGAKWVLLAGCIGTALTNLTIPFLAHFSFTMLILNRITMGIAQAGMEPGLMCLLAEWLTPAETGFFISMLLFAICIGFFLGSLCSSFLLTIGYGWPITYYVAGGMNLVVAIIWFLYANSRPGESKLISKEELKYIEFEQQFVKSIEEKENNKEINNDLKKIPKTNQSSLMHQNISTPIISVKQKQSETISSSSSSNFGKKINSNITQARLKVSDNSSNEASLKKGQAPWNNILRTPSVWAFIICKISIRWCADVLSIELPTYLANVLHLSIKLNGILNSVSSALFAICSFVTGYLVNELLKENHRSSDFLGQQQQAGNVNKQSSSSSIIDLGSSKTRKKPMSKTNIRKLMQSIASFGSAICVFLMTQYDCNIVFSMSMLLILSCCLVMGNGGELQIPYDMTSRYPGTLHGMACTLSVSGWLAPPLIGLILGDQPSSRYRWSLVWYLTALINLIGGLVFLLFADASPRDFDHQASQSERRVERSASKFESFSRLNIEEKENIEDLRKQLEKVEDRTISEGEVGTGDRGRHMMSYYNIACKSSDNSPPQRRSGQQQEGSILQQQQQQQLKQDLSWSSYFDRDLIKIRQIEDSFIKPSYLNNPDSIAQTQTMIFPYNTKPKQMKPKLETESCCSGKTTNSGMVNSEENNEYASNLVRKLDKQQEREQQILSSSKGGLIWGLWSRVPKMIVRKRRKFSFDEAFESSGNSRNKVGQQIRTKRKGDFEFKSSLNSVNLPDVLPHSRKQGMDRRKLAETRAKVRREEAEIEVVLSGRKAENSIMRVEDNKAREVHSERDGNQQLLQSVSAATTIATNKASTMVSSIMAPLASKTITHL